MTLICLLGTACPTGDHYHLAQYHEPDNAWQEFDYFTNICTERLCHPDEGDCEGTLDRFVLDTDAMVARNRHTFFEGCQECTRDNSLFLVGEGFRTGGRYTHAEGPGSLDLSGYNPPPIGHIRRYSRGACSFQLNLLEIPLGGGVETTFTDLLATNFQAKMEDGPGVESVDIEEAESAVYLGSQDCSDENMRNRDYIHNHLQLFAMMGEDGLGVGCMWRVETDLWFIPTTRLVDGQRRFDVTQLGFQYTSTNWSVPGAWWCDAFYDGFRSNMDELVADPRGGIFDELVETVNDMLWLEDLSVECGTGGVCPEALAAEYNFSTRCNGQSNRCEFRPNDIYSVNLYPSSIELVLAQSESDPEYLLLTDPNAIAPVWWIQNLCWSSPSLRVTTESIEWLY